MKRELNFPVIVFGYRIKGEKTIRGQMVDRDWNIHDSWESDNDTYFYFDGGCRLAENFDVKENFSVELAGIFDSYDAAVQYINSKYGE